MRPFLDDPSDEPELWTVTLDEWLAQSQSVHPDSAENSGFSAFPKEDFLFEYLGSVHDRSDEEVTALLRHLLLDQATYGSDVRHVDMANAGVLVRRESEYERRLDALSGRRSGKQAHPGVRWILDLLPHWPLEALSVINAYILGNGQILPDWPLSGLYEAAAVIRAFYLDADLQQGLETLSTLTPRAFEQLVAALYRKMGYDVELTPSTADGGKDVVASRVDDGSRQLLFVECKLYAGPVGVETVRGLLGVVANARATSGVLVTNSRLTRGARALVADEPRLHAVEAAELLRLLSERFGRTWPVVVDRIVGPQTAT